MKVDKNTFFRCINKFDTIPFLQSKGWLESASIDNIEYFVDSDVDPNVACWAIKTEHKIIGKKLIIESLCKKKNVAEKIIVKFLRSIIAEGYDSVYLSDISEASPQMEIALRRSGLKRPLALGLCPMSIVVDCTQPFKFHRNWNRQVKKSRDNHNKFTVIQNPSDKEIEDFVRLFNMLKDRKKLGFSISAQQIKCLTDAGDFFLSFVYDPTGIPLCGRMTYVHNKHAYDVFAANSDRGLKEGAIYHNQEDLLVYLKDKGILDFDYGRIPPGTNEMDNIYVSKSYSGGRPIIYNGEWEFAKSNLKNWMYNFYRYAVRKSRRY